MYSKSANIHRPKLIHLISCMVIAASIFGAVISSTQAETINWNNPAGGTWNTATNWDPQDVPNEAGEVAVIPDDGSAYTVTLNTSVTFDQFDINNPDAIFVTNNYTLELLLAAGLVNAGTISVNSSPQFIGNLTNQVGGEILIPTSYTLETDCPDVTNNGLINLNSNVGSSNSTYRVDSNQHLHGSGEFWLQSAGHVNDAEIASLGDAVLTITGDQNVHGAGTIAASLINEVSITADDTGRTLQFSGGDKINRATISAEVDCTALFQNCTVTQEGAGLLHADGGKITLSNGASIVGGELTSSNGGFVLAQGNPSITDILNSGSLYLYGSYYMSVYGSTLTNNGVFSINENESSTNAELIFRENVAIGGSGEILLIAHSSSTNDAQIKTDAGITITQNAGHEIRGSGEIAATLINNGLITADDPAQHLKLFVGDKTNNNLVSAAPGCILDLTTVQVTQGPSGMILADGGQVSLNSGASIIGGTIDTENGGLIRALASGIYLTDLTSEGSLNIKSSAIANLAGSSFQNDGRVTIHDDASTLNAELRVNENLTISGIGEIVLEAGTNTNDAELSSSSGSVLTQASGHTIRGTGEITAAVINNGFIIGDDSVGPLKLQVEDKVNNSLISAQGDGVLAINGILIDQTAGGSIMADGANVTLYYSATVMGGTVNSAPGGVVKVTGGTVYFDEVTNLNELEVNHSCTLRLSGPSFVNQGSILLNANNGTGNALLHFDSPTAVTGSGRITLQLVNNINDAQLNTVNDAVVTFGSDQLINGSGQVRAALINEGEIRGDVDGKTLAFTDHDKINTGLVTAVDKGTVLFSSGALTNTGTVSTVDTSVVRLNGSGALTNEGEVVITTDGLFDIASGLFDNNALARASNGGLLYQSDGTLDNEGLMVAEHGGRILLDYGVVRNKGVIEAQPGGSFWCDRLAYHYSSPRLSNGEWVVRGSGEMRLIGANVSILNAGVVLDGPGSLLRNNDSDGDALANLHTIESAGKLEIQNGRDFTTIGALASAGIIEVGTGCNFVVADQFSQTGVSQQSPQFPNVAQTIVNGTMSLPVGLVFDLQGGILSGNGTILNDVFSADRVNPGASVGELTIDGDYTQTTDGTFYVEIDGDGPGECDHLVVTGHASLDGRIWIDTADDAALEDGDILTVMTFASSDGTFTELWGNAGIGLIYEVVINATNAEIHIHADLSYVEDEEVGSNDESGSDPNGGDSAGDPNPIEDHVSELPTAIKFSAASINCSSAIFRFELPQPAQIALDIFDFSGRQVGSFSIDAPAGYFEQTWAGEQHGNRLPSGVYFGRARINGSEETFESTTRVLLVR